MDIVPKPIPAKARPIPKGETALSTVKKEFLISFETDERAFLFRVEASPTLPINRVNAAIVQLPNCCDRITPNGAPIAMEL